ncbi:SIMPL domain-containing protein [Virgibacillus ihumii]|uniref:SIMPL domain-containing protein n=1 Tax=Virgibacillus ihumii TaxID=2686091 RepID=UPI00157C31A5|nr:SIMPL domain-containing protein [Virgibacillus ihumii]
MLKYEQRIMSVTGTAAVSAEPDIATVELQVVTENMTLSDAQRENNQRMNQVIQALLNIEISQEKIQTTAYNIYPMYDYVDGVQQFRGYEVTHAIEVTIENINQTGNVIDTAVKNGVNRVSDIQFTISDWDEIYQQSLSMALRNAYAKAQTLAATMKLTVMPIPVQIDEQINEDPAAYKTYATAESSTNIQPGQMEIAAHVEVKYLF